MTRKCANCGGSADGLLDIVPPGKDGKEDKENTYCSDCVFKALRWGMKKWREAGAP